VVDFTKQKGNSKTKTSNTFKISRPTIDLWLKLDKEGKLDEVKDFHRGKTSGVDLVEFQEYINQNPDKYYREIGENFNIGKSHAQRLAVKLNITVKKTNYLQ
jgi:transposase